MNSIGHQSAHLHLRGHEISEHKPTLPNDTVLSAQSDNGDPAALSRFSRLRRSEHWPDNGGNARFAHFTNNRDRPLGIRSRILYH